MPSGPLRHGIPMHSSFFDLLFGIMFGVFGLVGLPMPVSVPPLPDQPALLHVVPADALGFVCWNGSAAADPKSTNLTERLAAEPEVRAMVAQLRSAFVTMVQGEGQELPATMVKVAMHALERPGCVFVRRFGPKPQIEAGVVVHFGEQKQGAVELLTALVARASEHLGNAGAPHPDQEIDGVTFHSFGTPADRAFVGWAEVDGWITLAIGNEMPGKIVAGLRGKDQGIEANADYTTLAKQCAVARPSTKSFIDLARLRTTFVDLGLAAESLDPIIAALGLTGAKGLVAQTGLEGTGFVQRLRLHAPAKNGLLGALTGQPLSQDELLHVPLDAQLALAVRLDGKKIEQALLALAQAITGQDVAADYERDFVGEFPQQLGGAQWREDLLDHVGEQLTVWNAPSQGGMVFTGLTGLLQLRDGARFAAGFTKVMDVVRTHMPDKATLRASGKRLQRGMETMESFVHAGTTVHWLNDIDDHVFAPAWAVIGDHLVASLLPQPLRAFLDAQPANPDRSLAKLPEIARRGAATAMFYWNAKDVIATGYPVLLAALRMNDLEWQRDGFDFDAADLPQPAALLPHLGRELLLWTPVDGGWQLQRSGTIPAFDPLTLGVVGGLVALLDEVL